MPISVERLRHHSRRLSSTPNLVATSAALIALIIQPVLFYWTVVVNPRAHIPYDIQGFHLPLAAYIGRCAREGIAPLWNPYLYCGMPLHADSQAQLFYPIAWIAVLLGNLSEGRHLFYWLECLIPLHMLIAGVGAYALLRYLAVRPAAALLGASIYQLGGFFASQAQHLGVVSVAAWLPVVLLAAFRLRHSPNLRWISILGLSLAMAILAGFAAATAIVFGCLFLTLFGLLIMRDSSWKVVPAVLLASILAASIAAVQIFPTYQLAQLSIASVRSTWHLSGGGLRLQSLASFVIPNYYHIFTPFSNEYRLPGVNFTFLYTYCGIFGATLAIIAPFYWKAARVRLFFTLTLVSAIWMLGDELPPYRILYQHLPGFVRGALYAEYALMAFCMFTAVTAALVLDRCFVRRHQWALWLIAALTSADLIYFGSNRPMNTAPGSYEAEYAGYDGQGGASTIIDNMRALANQTTPPQRWDYLDSSFVSGIFGPHMLRVPSSNGDNPFLLKRMLALRLAFSSGHYWERNLPVDRVQSPLIDMMNIGFLAGASALPAAEAQRAGLVPIKEVDGLHFYRNSEVLPRFFLVPKVYRSSGHAQSLSRLADPAFNPGKEAVVEVGERQETQGALTLGDVRVDAYTPNRVALTVSAPGSAFLASSEPMYPGWTAHVNGAKSDFVMTNGAFRGLHLHPGKSRIVMEYHPVGFLPLTVTSIFALALTLGGAAWKSRSRSGSFGAESSG